MFQHALRVALRSFGRQPSYTALNIAGLAVGLAAAFCVLLWVQEQVRTDAALQDAVIFVVTSSDAPKDITAAYARNIAGYIVKDNATESLRSALNLLKSYCSIVRLPEASTELRMA